MEGWSRTISTGDSRRPKAIPCWGVCGTADAEILLGPHTGKLGLAAQALFACRTWGHALDGLGGTISTGDILGPPRWLTVAECGTTSPGGLLGPLAHRVAKCGATSTGGMTLLGNISIRSADAPAAGPQPRTAFLRVGGLTAHRPFRLFAPGINHIGRRMPCQPQGGSPGSLEPHGFDQLSITQVLSLNARAGQHETNFASWENLPGFRLSFLRGSASGAVVA